MNRGDVVVVARQATSGGNRSKRHLERSFAHRHTLPNKQLLLKADILKPIFFRLAVEPTPENGLLLPSEIMIERLQAANKSKIGKVIGPLDASR